MSWDASATLQLLAILGSIASVGMAWYQRKPITAASHWLCAKASHLRSHATNADKLQVSQVTQINELQRYSSWDDPNIEACAATSAWREEARYAVDKYCARPACCICLVATPMAKARILHPRQFEADKQQAIKIRELSSLDAVNEMAGAAPSAGKYSASNELK